MWPLASPVVCSQLLLHRGSCKGKLPPCECEPPYQPDDSRLSNSYFGPSLSRLGADFMNYENFPLFNDLRYTHGLRPRQGGSQTSRRHEFGGVVSPPKYPTRNFLTWSEMYTFQKTLSTIIIAR